MDGSSRHEAVGVDARKCQTLAAGFEDRVVNVGSKEVVAMIDRHDASEQLLGRGRLPDRNDHAQRQGEQQWTRRANSIAYDQ